MRFVGIAGSLRFGSRSLRAVQLALRMLEEMGHQVELLDLAALTLPFCNGGSDYTAYPDVEKMRQAVRQADGVVLCTPEYHGSLSGVLKNALDLMDGSDLRGKPVGVMAVLGGEMSMNATGTLRMILRHLHAIAVTEQAIFPYSDKLFDPEAGELPEEYVSRVQKMVQQLATLSEQLRG